jgi:uncharacterized membrane protein
VAWQLLQTSYLLHYELDISFKTHFVSYRGPSINSPTTYFIKQRKGDPNESVSTPGSVFLLLKLELTLLVIIPLLAGLMSHGVGYFGK